MKTKRAFTLIELLVVIAIIALLLSIVVPALKKAKDYVKRTVCSNNMRQVGLAVNTYVQENDQKTFPNYSFTDGKNGTPEDMPEPHNSYKVYSPGEVKPGSNKYKPYHLAILYELGYIDQPMVFYCPAQPRTTGHYVIPYYYDFYVGQGNPSDYYNPDQHMGGYEWGTVLPADPRGPGSEWCRTSFNYWTYGETKIEKLGGYRPFIFDNIQEWEVVPHRKGRGPSSIPQGLSVLYVDGHVSFCQDPYIFDDTDNWPWNKRDPSVGSGPGNSVARFMEVLRRLQGN